MEKLPCLLGSSTTASTRLGACTESFLTCSATLRPSGKSNRDTLLSHSCPSLQHRERSGNRLHGKHPSDDDLSPAALEVVTATSAANERVRAAARPAGRLDGDNAGDRQGSPLRQCERRVIAKNAQCGGRRSRARAEKCRHSSAWRGGYGDLARPPFCTCPAPSRHPRERLYSALVR